MISKIRHPHGDLDTTQSMVRKEKAGDEMERSVPSDRKKVSPMCVDADNEEDSFPPTKQKRHTGETKHMKCHSHSDSTESSTRRRTFRRLSEFRNQSTTPHSPEATTTEQGGGV
ncbi:hypothetical protein FQA47_002266 [Oryzias melastigma]|uniref:Uncharacterized protein n=1 Tax=Oryzias melastigma TaxID=30732 RepID=A0A834F422_ORYME|nr:hypothetical protein FQA47_002266 [Oryzias melastigma]